MPTEIILASSSVTRRALMDRLGLNYRVISPDLDESPWPDEPAEQLVARLAQAKAAKVAAQYPSAIVIAADQVAYAASQPTALICKPYSVAAAEAQLRQQSAQLIHFCTGLAVHCRARGFVQHSVVPFAVQFRDLSDAEIRRYVAQEQPLACAGSFKCEGLGLSLFASMHGEDYTALMGLPLLQLCGYLRQLSLPLP
jgi:MAF protein